MVSHTRIAAVLLLVGGSVAPKAQTGAPLEVAGSFLAVRSIQANTADGFWPRGGSLQLGADAFHGLGVAANVSGVHTASVGSGGVPLSLVTAVFGPRYRWRNGHRVSLYGEALLGEANGFRSLFPSDAGAGKSANSLALQVGGGVDFGVSRHFALRLLDAGWLRTQLANGGNDRQNSLRLASGFVLRFGH